MNSCKKFLKKLIGTQYEWECDLKNINYLLHKHLSTFHPVNFLDIGCGSGDRTKKVAEYFKIDLRKTYGLDCNEKQVAEWRKISNAELIDLESKDLPYQNNTFDLILCNQVLEHLKNYQKVLFEIQRVVRHNGYIIIGIPNLAHLINRIFLLLGIQPMCISIVSNHVRSFTHKNFIELLNGFHEMTLLDCTGSLMYPLPYHLSKYFSKLFPGLCGYTSYLLQKK